MATKWAEGEKVKVVGRAVKVTKVAKKELQEWLCRRKAVSVEEFNFRAVNANFCQSNNAGLLQWVFSDGVDVQAADDGIVRERASSWSGALPFGKRRWVEKCALLGEKLCRRDRRNGEGG